MTKPVYATREDVQRAVDSKPTARNAAQIDRALQAASRDVDLLCHRRFYPELATRRVDWPARVGASVPWILRLDANEVISVSSLTSGGQTISSSDFLLRRADDRDEPPYTRIELNLTSNAAFGQGSTYQQDVAITGLFGYRNDETTVGALASAVGSATATTVTVNAAASAEVGVGSLLRIDSERLIVTGRTMAATGQTLTADVTQQVNTVLIPVTDTIGFAVDETILIDGERMLIVDIAGTNLIVRRAWDGSPNAAHTAGATLYAARALTVERGVLGTTAASHSNGATVVRWDPPSLVRQLTIAQAIATLSGETSGYSKALRSGEGSSERNRDAGAVKSLRDQVWADLARKARVRSI